MTTYVIGHRNPDTDAICSAIAYAELKNKTGEEVTAAACGTANLRTKFALKKAGIPHPKLVMDVRPTVGGICRSNVLVTREGEPFMEVYRRMQKHHLKAIPVVDNDGVLVGMVPLLRLMQLLIPNEQDLAGQRLVRSTLARIRSVINGQFQLELDSQQEEQLIILIGAMSAEDFAERIQDFPLDRLLVLVGDRPSIQSRAIEQGVRALVVTGGYKISEELLEEAKEKGVAVLTSPIDTAMTALLVRSAKGVEEAILRDYQSFRPQELLHTVVDRVADSTQDLFPVIDDEGKLIGVFAKSDMIEPQPAKLVMVDHNEYGQAVKGAEQAQVLEVIDHHRIGGGLISREPIRFINDIVGSTCTMVARMYREKAIMPDPAIALCMASGIISDTLFLKSPTTTDVDRDILSWLRSYLPVNLEEYAQEFFAEGSTLSISSTDDILASDRKEYTENGWTIAVSQAEELGMERFWERKDDLSKALHDYANSNPVDFACLMITDIATQSSYLLVAGEPRIISAIDYPPVERELFDLPNIVSRKKQLLPQLMWVLNRVHQEG